MSKKKTAQQLNLMSLLDINPQADIFWREEMLSKEKKSPVMWRNILNAGFGVSSHTRVMRTPDIYLLHPQLMNDTFEARPYIIAIALQALLNNSLVILPTGLGKTYVAILESVHILESNKKVLFLTPTKPLSIQQDMAMSKTLAKAKTAYLTGRISQKKRPKMWQTNDIIVATAETILEELAKNSGVGRAEDIGLIVFDEVHHLSGNHAYARIAEHYLSASQPPLITGLTASPDADLSKMIEVQKKLQIDDSQVLVRSYDSPDVKPYTYLRFKKLLLLNKEQSPQQRLYKQQLITMLTQNWKRLQRISGKNLSDYVYRNLAGKVVGIRIKQFNKFMEELQVILKQIPSRHEKGFALIDWAIAMKLGNAIERLHYGMPEFTYFMQKQFYEYHKAPSPSRRFFAKNNYILGVVADMLREPIKRKLQLELAKSILKLKQLIRQDMSWYCQTNNRGKIIDIHLDRFEKLGNALQVELKKVQAKHQNDAALIEQLTIWSLTCRLKYALDYLEERVSRLAGYLLTVYVEYKTAPKPSCLLMMKNANIKKIISWLVHFNIWPTNNYPPKLSSMMAADDQIDWSDAWRDPKLKAITDLIKDLEKGQQMLIFVKYRDSLRKIMRFLKKKHPKVSCGQLTGTSSNYGDPGMKQKEQEQVLEQYRNKEIQILVATSIGEEGLDFPAVNILVFYEPISDVRRYIQRLGRTGRHNHGKVVILAYKDSAEETIYYSSRAEEQSVRKIIRYYEEKNKKTRPS
ncbi:MAG: helicase-related protein [Candidatus Komeilibacteria bacterium]